MDTSQLDHLREYCRDETAFEALKQILADQSVGSNVEQQDALSYVIAKIRASLDLDTIFKSTAVEVRRLLHADRVAVFRFLPDSGWNDGEFVSEDVASDFASALECRVHDHCFGNQYAANYQQGRFQAVADIYQAGLEACHIEVLSRFQVRANLVVPLLQDQTLWGLICIHQCAAARQWQPTEIEFVQKIAAQLGVALQQAELVEQLKFKANQQKILFNVVAKIRASLDLETIFKTTATEVRRLLQVDRVGIFRFFPNSEWNDGEFVSEDVAEGFSSAIAAKINDHCFGNQYAADYQAGRIQAVADIYKAGLKDCHIEVLAQFQIRANLVVPLLQGQTLWGLLCLHYCTHPHGWQPEEIDFVKQIATQLSVALRQAELLDQSRRQNATLTDALEVLKKAQLQLIHSEKMSSLGQLVAGIAHEINNPVNFIHGNLNHATQYAQDLIEVLGLYQKHYPQPVPEVSERAQRIDLEFLTEDFPRMLGSMHIGAERIRNIVLSLRNFSRLDDSEMKPTNIHTGLESTLLILQYRLKPRPPLPPIRLIKEYGDLPPVECHSSQLNQVFMNVLVNAIDAIEEAALSRLEHECTLPQNTITIQTSVLPSKVDGVPRALIRIVDNGPGISAEVQSRLFDSFFTTKPEGKGTGLGLSISHQIVVERHRGTLRCTSQPGQGTEFWIEIPIRQRSYQIREGLKSS